MQVTIMKSSRLGERRSALMPDAVARLAAKKIEVVVEPGVGARAFVHDADWKAAGARLASPDAPATQIFVAIGPPTDDELAALPEGATLIAPIAPAAHPERLAALNARKLTTLALDLIPRTTLAQAMDVLSSQATIAGYVAVLDAAAALPRFFPMLMTAAGTIAPARVLVLGAGVAGLSAIGTARRLGAVVEAFDVRAVVREQIESLGAKFVVVEGLTDAGAAGGYARAQTDEERERQAATLAKHVRAADVVIGSALVAGKQAPVLITEPMVAAMKPGSVIYDLAAEQGGNCALTVAGERIERHGVTIVGAVDVPSRLAVHASQMFSRNVEKLLQHLVRDGELRLAADDEIAMGCLLTRGGEVVHPRFRGVAS
jgi:NAD(P) transhydrogenase subunit alpha